MSALGCIDLFRFFVLLAGSRTPHTRDTVSDPRVIKEATAKRPTWRVEFIQQPRLNSGPLQHTERLGGLKEFQMSILNLFVALECDAFVCTRESNWCRLIDELRATWGGKAKLPYVEVGQTILQKNIQFEW